MTFDFDLKFGFKQETKEVFFEKGDTKLTYQLSSDDDILTWRTALKHRLNQRGFHIFNSISDNDQDQRDGFGIVGISHWQAQ